MIKPLFSASCRGFSKPIFFFRYYRIYCENINYNFTSHSLSDGQTLAILERLRMIKKNVKPEIFANELSLHFWTESEMNPIEIKYRNLDRKKA